MNSFFLVDFSKEVVGVIERSKSIEVLVGLEREVVNWQIGKLRLLVDIQLRVGFV